SFHMTLRAILYPYTTLFRSFGVVATPAVVAIGVALTRGRGGLALAFVVDGHTGARGVARVAVGDPVTAANRIVLLRAHHPADDRSEEHTSELQSRENLVCRL